MTNRRARTLAVVISASVLAVVVVAVARSGGPTTAPAGQVAAPATTLAQQTQPSQPLRIFIRAGEKTHGAGGNSDLLILGAPHQAYRDLDPPVPVVDVWNLLVVPENADEKLVYEITKTLFEHKGDLVKVHKDAAFLALANQLTGASPLPFHKGSLKYYQ